MPASRSLRGAAMVLSDVEKGRGFMKVFLGMDLFLASGNVLVARRWTRGSIWREK